MSLQNLKQAYENYKTIRGDDKSSTFCLLNEIVNFLIDNDHHQYPILPLEHKRETNPFSCPSSSADTFITPIEFRMRYSSVLSEVYIRGRLKSDSAFLDFCGAKQGCHYYIQPQRALWWLWNNSDNRVLAKLKRYAESLKMDL